MIYETLLSVFQPFLLLIIITGVSLGIIWGALPGYVKDGFVFTGETSVNVVNRMRGQGGSSASNKDYRPASPDTESYQGAPDDP